MDYNRDRILVNALMKKLFSRNAKIKLSPNGNYSKKRVLNNMIIRRCTIIKLVFRVTH